MAKPSPWVALVFNDGDRREQPHGRLCTIISMSGTPAHYSEEHLLAYPVEYIAGIDLYNAGEYHAAHDAWEERWMGPVAPDEKLFLQAMIQSAVAFHHLQIGRPGAARRMYLMAKEKFARLNQPIFMSLDLADYQAQLDRALSWLLSVPDPREIEQPQIEPPVICLIAIAKANS
jgi:hypothetical protein